MVALPVWRGQRIAGSAPASVAGWRPKSTDARIDGGQLRMFTASIHGPAPKPYCRVRGNPERSRLHRTFAPLVNAGWPN